MNIEPCNKHLLVEMDDVAPEVASVLVPEEYKITREFETVKIISVSHDCDKFDFEKATGHFIIVPTNMLQDISFLGCKYYLIQENYVLATIGGEHA